MRKASDRQDLIVPVLTQRNCKQMPPQIRRQPRSVARNRRSLSHSLPTGPTAVGSARPRAPASQKTPPLPTRAPHHIRPGAGGPAPPQAQTPPCSGPAPKLGSRLRPLPRGAAVLPLLTSLRPLPLLRRTFPQRPAAPAC